MPKAIHLTSIVFGLYLLLLVWVPIPLGSNRAWSGALLEIWVFALAIAWLAGRGLGRFRLGPAFRNALPLVGCCVAWVAYVWAQLVPLPIDLLQLVSPQSARWHIAAASPASLSFAPITLDIYATLESACKSTAYVTFLFLSLVLLGERDRVRFATYALILSGLFQALYGAFTSFQNPAGVATGTFVNRNHYAAYLVMCLSVGIGVLIASLSDERAHSWRQRFKGVVEWMITPKMGLRLLLVTMVIALVMTRSRMGNISFFIALAVAGAIGLLLSRNATRSMSVLLVSLILVDVLIVGAYFGTQRVVERIGQTTLDTEDRDEVAGYALEMWKDFPVFGSGLGSFSSVFPRYSGEGTAASYTHAHNDHVELAAEVGVIGFSLLAFIVLSSFFAALRAQQRRRDPVLRGISFAAIMGITGLMIHCTADFNLQIPANALTFMLLLSFGWIANGTEPESRA